VNRVPRFDFDCDHTAVKIKATDLRLFQTLKLLSWHW